ncbi:MAG: purine-nucleoside phosphorylase [Eubacterium sp.]|nr:purine-nucleoside phosphorylase [Eubacterium sp.]
MNRQDMLENPVYEKLCRCVQEVKKKIDFQPEVALVLGSGLGEYAREMDVKAVVPYKEIPGFPVSTVAGHQGRFLFGYVKQVPVVAMQGRVHYYEGYPITDVVLPVRLMGLLGAKKLILTNAAGGVNFSFNPGTLMVITDHIASMVPNPLIGPNMEELGTRFSDMSEIYDRKLREIILQAGRNTGVSLQQGVYVQLTGPSYESPAEIRMCRAMGADAVGMSTACEAVAARHMGLQVCGISCITNMAAGMSGQPLNHEEVQETADRVAEEFCRLVTETIGLMGAEKGS